MKSIDVVIPAKDGGPRLVAAASMWLAQILPAGWEMTLIVVNDGSVDGAPEELTRKFGSRVKVINHARPIGRGGACNAGAAAGTGFYIAFFDADCMPVSEHVLRRHITALQRGYDLTFGRVEASGEDFWARYFRRVSLRREQRFKLADKAALTTANVVIRRGAFESAGGFDARYRHYGFEDRDIVLRLLEKGAEADFVDAAGVVHEDHLNLTAVAGKMYIAGKFTAPIFSGTHPDAYRGMDYYRVDTRCHGVLLYVLGTLAKPVLGLFLAVSDWWLRMPIPFALKAGIVRICSGMAYMVGTRDAPGRAERQ